MNEGDPVSPAPHTRLPVDQLDSRLLEVGKGRIEVRHLKGDVVQPFAARSEKAADRGVLPQRHQQLQVRTPEGNHRLLDALLLDHLSVGRSHPVLRSEVGKSGIEVADCDGGVVDIEGKHSLEANGHNLVVLRRGKRRSLISVADN